MKKQKGFTLVELVAVVTILLALTTIAVVSVTGILDKSDTQITEIQENLIKQAAQSYVLENLNDWEEKSEGTYLISVTNDLVDGGYFDDDSINGTVKVTITKNADGTNKYKYEYQP